MPSISQQQQQFDHAAWRDALRGWREDTARWRADHEYLLGRLADLQSAVNEHDRCLSDHEAAFETVEKSLAEHEELIDLRYDAGQTGQPQTRETQHQAVSMKVRHLKDAHERMARHHENVVARMADLEKATSSPL